MDLTAERLLLAYHIVNLVAQTGENGEEKMNVSPTPNSLKNYGPSSTNCS